MEGDEESPHNSDEESSGNEYHPKEVPIEKKRATGTCRSTKTTIANTAFRSDDSSGDEYDQKNPRVQNQRPSRPQRSAATNKSRITLADYDFSEDSEDESMKVDKRGEVESSDPDSDSQEIDPKTDKAPALPKRRSTSDRKVTKLILRSTSEESSGDDYQPNITKDEGFKQRWVGSRKRLVAKPQRLTGTKNFVVTSSDSEELSDDINGSGGEDMELDEEDDEMEVDDNDPSGPVASAGNHGFPIDQWKLPVQTVGDWFGLPKSKKQKKGTQLPEHMHPRITKDHKMAAAEIQKLLVDTYNTVGVPKMVQKQEIREKTGLTISTIESWFRRRNQTLEERMDFMKKERERLRKWRGAGASRVIDFDEEDEEMDLDHNKPSGPPRTGNNALPVDDWAGSPENKKQKKGTPLPEHMIPKIRMSTQKMEKEQIQKLLEDTFRTIGGMPTQKQKEEISKKTGKSIGNVYDWFRVSNQTMEQRMDFMARKRKREKKSRAAREALKKEVQTKASACADLPSLDTEPEAKKLTTSANSMQTVGSQSLRRVVLNPDQPMVNSAVHLEADSSINDIPGNQRALQNPNPFHKFEDFSSLDLKYLHGRFMEYKDPEFDQLVMWGMVTQRDTYQIYRWVKSARLACGEQQVEAVNSSDGLDARDSLLLTKKYKENSYPTVTQISSWASEIQKNDKLVFTWIKKNYEVLQEKMRKEREDRILMV